MVVQLDTWRTADLLLRQHGPEAAAVAARRSNERVRTNDFNGVAAWRRIIAAIGQLSRVRGAGAGVN